MRPHSSIWQGCCDHWQPLFIRENLLSLGYAAWQGYLTQGRGLVACDVTVVDAMLIDWSHDPVTFCAQFIPVAELPTHLKAHSLTEATTTRILKTAQQYHPDRELILAISGNGEFTLNWLCNLAIAPPDCYSQVRNRWSEFTLAPYPNCP